METQEKDFNGIPMVKSEKNSFIGELIVNFLGGCAIWLPFTAFLVFAYGGYEIMGKPLPPVEILYIAGGFLFIIFALLLWKRNWLAIMPFQFIITTYWLITIFYG